MSALLHPVPGGLRLTRRPSLDGGIKTLPTPRQVVLPLNQHAGRPALPVVSVGDSVTRGQCVGKADGVISVSVHASVAGTVTAIESRPVPGCEAGPSPCVIIDAAGQQDQQRPEPLDHDYHLDEPSRLRQVVSDAGIAGLGGAVFPTAVKLAAEVDMRLQTLIINGAECDPAISCDDALMREYASEIVAGARCMLHILQVNRCIIATKSDNAAAGQAMKQAVTACDDERVTWRQVPGIYPQGGERQLIQRLSGLEVPSDGLPLDIGFLCHNVATARAVYRAVEFGEPLTDRVVAVRGKAVTHPQHVLVPLGTPIADVIAFCGGYAGTPTRLVMGGEMMGIALSSDELPVVKACNALLVMDASETPSSPAPDPCIRCGDCATVCPASLQPQQLHWHSAARDLDQLVARHLFDCIECGCCDLVCPSHIPLTEQFRAAKRDVHHRDAAHVTAQHARRRFEQRNARLERLKAQRDARRAARTAKPPPSVTPKQENAPGPSRKDEIRAAVERAKARRAQRENDREV
ncbi:MAG: electron transport complex subunit RsxC [Gammaproteobacteria bacterium]